MLCATDQRGVICTEDTLAREEGHSAEEITLCVFVQAEGHPTFTER